MIPTDPGYLEGVLDRVTGFVADQVEEAGARGVVVALSGGVDSGVTAAVAAEALGPGRVVAVSLPDGETETQREAVRDAEAVAEALDLELRTCDVRGAVEAVQNCGVELADPTHRSRINVPPRVRMTLTYLVANAEDRLVLGTGNRSEILTGYFTKHGDGAADLLPLGDLYKTQVYGLARLLELPTRVVEKEPTAGLYPGQTDREELGLSYDALDPVLHLLVDRGETMQGAAKEAGLPPETVERVRALIGESGHKRGPPPTPGLP